jgi:ubiquinone/menaquinone biosynthesis C-methylase UbiE
MLEFNADAVRRHAASPASIVFQFLPTRCPREIANSAFFQLADAGIGRISRWSNLCIRRSPGLVWTAQKHESRNTLLERGGMMSSRLAQGEAAAKAAHRAMWAMGDYDRFARATVWELGPQLVDACPIKPGHRVLDVAAGTGNVAIRAAMKGASVVACDLTPEHFAHGRRGAAAAGVTLEWIEGDAEAPPFDDSTFDVVTSCFGAMFAPDHQAVTDELVRVCRPGGTIGLVSFTPEGTGGEFFALLAPYAPPAPAGASPPVLWGSEEYVRTQFGRRLSSLALSRHTYIERAPSPEDYCRLFIEAFGPLVAIRASLDHDPERRAELDRRFLEAVIRWNRGRSTGPVEIAYEYLLAIGTRASQ